MGRLPQQGLLHLIQRPRRALLGRHSQGQLAAGSAHARLRQQPAQQALHPPRGHAPRRQCMSPPVPLEATMIKGPRDESAPACGSGS